MTTASFRSCARWYDPFVNMLLAIAAFGALYSTSLSDTTMTTLVVLAVMLPMVLVEFLRNAENLPHAHVTLTKQAATRAAIKWLGVMGGIAVLYAVWWLFPLYDSPYYAPINDLAALVIPPIAVIAAYLLYMECRLGEQHEISWHSGLLLLGRWREINWQVMKDGAFVLLVRAVFLPLNFCSLLSNIRDLRQYDASMLDVSNWPNFHANMMQIIYTLLIATIVPGYVFSARLINTHVRAIDTTWFGWAVTMACYPPFVGGVFGALFNYHPHRFDAPYIKPWIFFTDGTPWLLYTMGAAIILCELVHLWGEAILGIRASNLSHRGVISNGPFRYTRHPIYVSKCLGWLLISLPFLMGDTVFECLRLMLLWFGVCGIYVLRSAVEERVFMDDPNYVSYALWVDKHGAFAWFGKQMPWLTFAWRYRRWHASSQ